VKSEQRAALSLRLGQGLELSYFCLHLDNRKRCSSHESPSGPLLDYDTTSGAAQLECSSRSSAGGDAFGFTRAPPSVAKSQPSLGSTALRKRVRVGGSESSSVTSSAAHGMSATALGAVAGNHTLVLRP
jgi:hypothetical protein